MKEGMVYAAYKVAPSMQKRGPLIHPRRGPTILWEAVTRLLASWLALTSYPGSGFSCYWFSSKGPNPNFFLLVNWPGPRHPFSRGLVDMNMGTHL
jgi:hypothetical protein